MRVTFSEANSLGQPSSASLPRKPGAVKTMHKKSRSMDSIDRGVDILSHNNDEDNFSDTDDEEQWDKEKMVTVPETTMVTVPQTAMVTATQTTYV